MYFQNINKNSDYEIGLVTNLMDGTIQIPNKIGGLPASRSRARFNGTQVAKFQGYYHSC